MLKFMAVQFDKDRTSMTCLEGLLEEPKKRTSSLYKEHSSTVLRFAKLHLKYIIW